jgi:hypothetical protein
MQFSFEKRLFQGAVGLGLLLFVAGISFCQTKAPTPVKAPASVKAQAKASVTSIQVPDGTWNGSTTDGKKISFTVTKYQLTGSREIPLAFSCPDAAFQISSGALVADDVSPLKIMVSRATGGVTIFDDTLTAYGLKITVRGRVLPDRSAAGTITYAGPCTVQKAWKATRVADQVAKPPADVPTPLGDPIVTYTAARIPFTNVTLDKDGLMSLTKESAIGTPETMRVSSSVLDMGKMGYRVGLDENGTEVRYVPKQIKFVRGVPVVEFEGGYEFTVRFLPSGGFGLNAVVTSAVPEKRSTDELIAEWKKNPAPEAMYAILQYNASVEVGKIVRQIKEGPAEAQAAKLDEIRWLIHPATNAILKRIANDPKNPNSGKAKAILDPK